MADDDSYDIGGTKVPKSALNEETRKRLDAQFAASAQAQKLGVPGVAAPTLADVAQSTDAPLPTGPVNLNGPLATPTALAPKPLLSQMAPPPHPEATGAVDMNQFTAPPAASAAPALIPMEQTTSVTRGPSLDKSQIATMDKDFAQKQKADQHFADEQAEVARRQNIQRDVFAQQNADAQAQETLKQQAQDDLLKQETAKGAELANTIGKVDPKRYKKDQGIGGNILSAIALGLGALGAGLTKGPNTALEIYNRKVDADIDAQKEEIAVAKDKAQLQNNRVAQIMSQGHDLQQSIQLARASRYADLQRAVEAEAAKSGDQEIQARAAQMAAGAKSQYDDAMVQYQQGAKARITTNTQKQLGIPGKMPGKKAENVPASEATKLSDIDEGIVGIDKLLKTIKSPGNAPGAGAAIAQHFGGTDATAYNDQRAAIMPAIAKANDLTLSDRNKEILESMLPGASKVGMTPDTAKQQLMQQKAMLIQKRQAMLGRLGSAGFNTSAMGSGGGAPPSFRPASSEKDKKFEKLTHGLKDTQIE